MDKFLDFAKRPISLLGITTIVLIGGLFGYRLQINANQLSVLSTLFDGIQTCYARTHQSYVAHLLKRESSTYLTSKFLTTTEDCVGEVISLNFKYIEDHKHTLSKKLNAFSSKILQYHSLFLRPEKEKDIRGSFSGIERSFLESIDILESMKKSTQKDLNISSMIFFALSFFSIIIILAFFFYFKKLNKAKENIENWANSEVTKDGPLVSAIVEEILTKMMEASGYKKCIELFSKYHIEVLSGKHKQLISKEYVETKKDRNRHEMESLNFNKIIDAVLEKLSPTLMSSGIILESNIEEGLEVYGNEEAVCQIIFTVLDRAKNESLRNDLIRKISIKAKGLGGSLMLQVLDTGETDQEEMKEDQLKKIVVTENPSIDLTICRELCSDINADLSVKTYKDNEESGTKIQILFDRKLNESKRKMVSKKVTIKRGKKREFKEIFSQNSSGR